MKSKKELKAQNQPKKKVIKIAKGYFGRRKNIWTVSKNAVERGLRYAYRDRKLKNRSFRALWIQRINAGVKQYGLSYTQFMGLLKEHKIDINRKQLADLATNHPQAFEEIIRQIHPSSVEFREKAIVQTKVSLECEVYLDTEDITVAEEYYEVVKTVADSIGFEVSKQNKPIIGSWFRRFWIRSHKVVDRDEVQKRLEKLERELNKYYSGKHESSDDLNTAQVIGVLMANSRGIPRIVIRIGNLLFIKLTVNGEESIFTEILTRKQLTFLKKNPSLTRRPEELLVQLESLEMKSSRKNRLRA